MGGYRYELMSYCSVARNFKVVCIPGRSVIESCLHTLQCTLAICPRFIMRHSQRLDISFAHAFHTQQPAVIRICDVFALGVLVFIQIGEHYNSYIAYVLDVLL